MLQCRLGSASSDGAGVAAASGGAREGRSPPASCCCTCPNSAAQRCSSRLWRCRSRRLAPCSTTPPGGVGQGGLHGGTGIDMAVLVAMQQLAGACHGSGALNAVKHRLAPPRQRRPQAARRPPRSCCCTKSARSSAAVAATCGAGRGARAHGRVVACACCRVWLAEFAIARLSVRPSREGRAYGRDLSLEAAPPAAVAM
jgi:hypothetical protein